MADVTVKGDGQQSFVVKGDNEVSVLVSGALTGPRGFPGVVQSIVAGTGITVDSTDPAAPIVSGSASYPASSISNTPAGNISATNVQAAINELDTEKQPLDADLTTIAGLTATTNNFMVGASSAWASRTPAQAKTALSLAKADVGLSNVDNTSDASKPISTLTQAALDLKVVGPGTVTNKGIARYSGTTGLALQDSAVTIEDTTGALIWAGMKLEHSATSTVRLVGASDGVGAETFQVSHRYATGNIRPGVTIQAANSSDATGSIAFNYQGSPKGTITTGISASNYLVLNTCLSIAGITSGTVPTVAKLMVGSLITGDNTANVHFTATAIGSKPLVIQAFSSGQTAPLTEWQTSGGSPRSYVGKDGLYYPYQAPTASAPTYVVGAMYYDTTLNKLRIGGASGWETVTSV